jgi:hypothetical protein
MQYTEIELKELIKAVETEFSAHLAKAEVSAQPETLAKAEGEKKEEKPSEEKEAPAKEEPKEEKEAPKAEDKKDEAPAKEEGEAAAPAKEEAAAPAAEEAPVAPSADEGASGYDAEDIAHMDAMYMSMSKAELLAHHDSCVRALDAIGAEHTHAAPAAPAAEAPAAPAAPAGDMSMAKSEANPELELAKSEAAAEKAKSEQLQKSLDTVTEFLTKLVKKVPQGKAITQYEQVAKSESAESEKELSKSEINSKLLAKSADPKLSKSDRDAINAYYLNQSNVSTISHLLK